MSTGGKVAFVGNVREQITKIAQVVDIAIDWHGAYFDLGYDVVGSDPITNDDIASTGLTATQFGSMITLLEDLNKFASNQAVSTSDRNANLNVGRTDLIT